MTTRVAITFDIEFDINGTFARPGENYPRGADGLLGVGDSNAGGLSFVLSTLDKFGLRATFFIETLQTLWFGLDEMGRIAQLLQGRGHELQLHVHPVWRLFEDPDWILKVKKSPPRATIHDNLAHCSPEEALATVAKARSVFQQWSLPPPEAVRTGSLMTERGLYSVFRQCGLTISSSVGLGLHQPQDLALRRFHSATHIDGVLELPVTSYRGHDHWLRPSTRLATVIGTGRQEHQALLSQARQRNLPFLVLLSHISEFQRRRGNNLHPNYQTEEKFRQICAHLAACRELQSVTISELVDIPPQTQEVPLQLDRRQSIGRHVENILQKMLSR